MKAGKFEERLPESKGVVSVSERDSEVLRVSFPTLPGRDLVS